MIRLGYFPGCSLSGTAHEYEMSIGSISNALGFELVEIKDWNCCGASSAHAINHRLALALCARNLALAEEQGIEILLSPCAMCYNRMVTTHKTLTADGPVKEEIEKVVGRAYLGKVRNVNFLEAVIEFGKENLERRVVRQLDFFRFACYYGCLLVRPPRVIEYDDPEDPRSMEQILSLVGAKTVDWPMKNECCGGGFSISRTDIVVKLARDILASAVEHGANAIVTACPMCHSNLDMRQLAIRKEYGDEFNMPVFFLSEILGLALDRPIRELGTQRHFINTRKILDEFARTPSRVK